MGGEAMEPVISFLSVLCHDPFVVSSPVGLMSDHLCTVVAANKYMPTEVTIAVDAIEVQGAAVSSGDVACGMAAVWVSIAQGKTVLRLARAMADKKTKELGTLTDVTAVLQNIKTYDNKDISVAVEILCKGTSALCAAIPKASTEAAREYCSAAKLSMADLLKRVVRQHVVEELAPWVPPALSAYTTTHTFMEPPTWAFLKLDTMRTSKLTHAIALGNLSVILDLHARFRSLSKVCCASAAVNAIEVVTLRDAWDSFMVANTTVVTQYSPSLAGNLSDVATVLDNLSTCKTDRELTDHLAAVGGVMSKVPQLAVM
jgi:hypothetical protein